MTSVRTGNAVSYGPMLAIRRRLGFTTCLAVTVWQLPVETAEHYRAEAGK